jgi:hypothetical protein
MREYDPWLGQTLAALQIPMTTGALDELVVEWRRRRAPYSFLLPERGDVIIVEPGPRDRNV